VGVCLRCAGERVLAAESPGAPPPAISLDLSPAERADIPPRIGRYEIIEEIGRGGMGHVYAARQLDLGRVVALKTILSGGRAATELELRFLREGQTMARLRHPFIMAVHDCGRADGHAFLAMDFVEGGDLARRLRERPLSPRDAATLVGKVAEALAYTHGEGVLHRDLKPSNILLEGDEPRVADFGLAADLEPGGDLTAVTKLIGTPHYLAPEAMRGGSAALSVASDLYALGAVLFEALTGRTPFAGATPAELPALLANAEPPSPRLLAPAVPRDLETICLKCLERESARRYSSAAALADDLRRFLAGEPIAARPPGRMELLRKFAQRHRAAVAATATIAVVLFTATAVSSWLAIRARRAEKLAAAEAQTSKELIAFLQTDLLDQAGPGVQPDRDIKLRAVVDRAAKKIDGRFADRPLAEAAMRESVAKIYSAVGEYTAARAQLERVVNLRRTHLGAENPQTLSAMAGLAEVWRQLAKYPEAEAIGRQALAAQRRVLGSEHVDTLATMNALAATLTLAGKFAESAALHLEALAVERRVLGPEHPATLTTMHDLAFNYDSQGKLAEAEQFYREAFEGRERTLGPEHPDTLAAMANLGIFYTERGIKRDEARALKNRSLELRRRVLGPEHPDTLASVNSLAADHLNAGNFAEAEKLHTEVYTIYQRTLGPDHNLTLGAQHNLAYSYITRGKLAEAEALFADCVARRRRLLGPEHPDTLRSMATFAAVYREQGKLDQSVELYRDILASRRKILGAEHPDTLRAMNALAGTLRAQGKLGDAADLLRETAEIRARVLGPEHTDTLASIDALVETLLQQKNFSAAEPFVRQSIAARSKVAPENWRTAAANVQLGEVLLRTGRLAEAEPLLTHGCETLQRAAATIPASSRGLIARAEARVIELYTEWGKPAEAAVWKNRHAAEAK
jgi:tetratricopeptide (TPR) repeat protein